MSWTQNVIDAESSRLTALLRTDDSTALRQMNQEYGGYVRQRLGRHFGSLLDHQELDAVVSGGLFRVWQSRNKYQPPTTTDPSATSIRNWFYVLSRHAALDYLRQRRFRRTTVPTEQTGDLQLGWHVPKQGDTTPPDSAPTVSREDWGALFESLQSELALLSELDQQILLRYADQEGQGAWAEELATELEIPPGTIRSRKHRAFARLKERLEHRKQELESQEVIMNSAPMFSAREEEEELITIDAGDLMLKERPRTPADRDRLKQLVIHWLVQREPRAERQWRRHFDAKWSAVVGSGARRESQQQLQQLWQWLQALDESRRDWSRLLLEWMEQSLDTVLSPPASLKVLLSQFRETLVHRLSQSTAFISARIESRLPDEAIREGYGLFSAVWSDEGVQVRALNADGRPSSEPVSLRHLIHDAFRICGSFSADESDWLTCAFIESLRRGRMLMANFSFEKPRSPKQPLAPTEETWSWTAPGTLSPVSELPDWLAKGEHRYGSEELDLELALESADPELAEVLDDVLLAATSDASTEDATTLQESVLQELVAEISTALGRSRSDVAAALSAAMKQNLRQHCDQQCTASASGLAFLMTEINQS